MMVGRRMPWYSIAVVLFLAYAANQCRSVVRKRTVENIELEGSYLTQPDLNMRELAVMLGTAKAELERVVEGASLEVGTESKKDTLLPCLTGSVCPPYSTWYKAATKGRVHTLIHMVYGNKQQNEVVMKEVGLLIEKVWEEMRDQKNLCGVYAKIQEKKKEGAIAGVEDEGEVIAGVGVYTITGNDPIYLGMLDLTPKADTKIRVVMGDKTHSFVNFREGVPERKVDQLPLVFQILLQKIEKLDDLFDEVSWTANFVDLAPDTEQRSFRGVKDVIFMYKPPERVYMEVIGSLRNIMYYVFHSLCNAIVHYKSPAANSAANAAAAKNQSFQRFAFIFNYFVISVHTQNWHTMTVDENVQTIKAVKLDDMYRQLPWWWEDETTTT